MIAVGTSGYSFRDWKGAFYPEKLAAGDYLAYYADHFKTVEINSTYYGIPKPHVFENMVNRTPDGFEFMVKAYKATTHDFQDEKVSGEFIEAIKPLKDAIRLSGVLVQFPWGFRNNERNRRYIAEIGERYDDFPFYVEFRHNSWNCEEIFDFLSRAGARFVSVDEPQIGCMMPPVAKATGDTAYIRFHGRNEKTWWGKGGDRYDYNYSEDELEEWIEKVEKLEKTVWKIYAFFNNCHQGYAVRNAFQLKKLAAQKGLKLQ